MGGTSLSLTVGGRHAFTASYPGGAITPQLRWVFQHTLRAYHVSTTRRVPIIWDNVPEPIHRLLVGYFQFHKLGLVPAPTHYAEPLGFGMLPLRPDRATVLCSGGKDSVHLAARLLETGWPAQDVQLVYVTNVNRSEAHYERQAVDRVARHLGIGAVQVPVTNGIRLNRGNHNIGLRQQLLLACALPHIVAFGSQRVFTGALHEWDEFGTYTSHQTTQAIFIDFLISAGVPITLAPHIDYPAVSDRGLLEDFIRRHRALLSLTASCFTQANFRERHHALLASKVPGLPIYHGCGVCVKCLRINAGLLLYDLELANAPRALWEKLRAHVVSAWHERFPDDPNLCELGTILEAIP